MRILLTDLSREASETFSLVLLSSGIESHTVKGRGGWELRVKAEAYDDAASIIRAYLQENRIDPAAVPLQAGAHGRSFCGLWGALVILAIHLAIAAGHDARSFVDAYGSSARLILEGGWYRCATSLLLHADYVHLAGNMVGLAVFGSAACSIMGWGVGWAMILASGVLGNLGNACFYETGHTAIGASTAVFGALGLLSSHSFIKKIRQVGERFQALLPLGAGFALLAFLGAAAHTDIMGHLFGFLAGLVLGAIYALLLKRPVAWPYQLAALALVLVVLAGAWAWPIMAGSL